MAGSDWIGTLPGNRCIAEISMWSADLARLEADLERVEPHGDVLHFDVADGVFAPSFLFFPDLVAALRKRTKLPFHIHLMVDDRVLLSQVQQFIDAGGDLISIHAENRSVADEALKIITDNNVAAGMVLRIETPVDHVKPYINDIRFLTLLGTAIGVKGQDLDEKAPARLTEAVALRDSRSAENRCIVAADGAIRDHTVPKLIAAGAETVVMGSMCFGSPDLGARMDWLASHGLRA